MISVIIPAYNSENSIAGTLKSILAQSYRNIEVIVVDDGSIDRTSAIVKEMSRQDPRVKLFSQPNSGAYHARLAGIKQAKGDWITFSDADDTLPADAFELLLSNITPDIDISIATLNLDNKRNFVHQLTGIVTPVQHIRAMLQGQTTVGLYAKLYRSSLFANADLRLDQNFKQNEDMLMLIRLSLHARKIVIDNDKVVYNYLNNPNGQSKLTTPMEIWLQLFEKLEHSLGNCEKFHSALVQYKVNIFYTEGVLKKNNLNTVKPRLSRIINEAESLKWHGVMRRRLVILKYPMLRNIKRLIWQTELRIKNVVKKISGYER